MVNDYLDWNDEAVAKLKSLLARGLTHAEIGAVMRTTKRAINAKVGRLGLRNRGPVNGGRKTIGRMKKMPAPPGPPLRRDVRQMEHDARFARAQSDTGKPARFGRVEPCAYVLQMKPSVIYCDEPSVPGKSMCRNHHSRCYIPDGVLATSPHAA